MLASDSELLGRHLFGDDESAFEELVRRHSTMVMNVCRTMLLNRDDAEDAFQATFLVLAKKASSLLKRNSIAGWLYHVAVRNCLHARRISAKKGVEVMNTEPVSAENEPWLSIAQVQDCELIHREIDQLPRRYRDAIVICHVQGHSRSEAAELLDQSEASIKAALSRGRNLLRQRLVRRGIMTTAILATIQASSLAAKETVPESLIQATLQTCTASSAAGLVGPSSTIQSIAQNGVTMSSTIFSKSILAIAGISIVCLPLIVLANSESNSKDINPLVLETPGNEASGSTAVLIDDENQKGTNPESKLTAPTENQNNNDALVDPRQFEIENSQDYWQLMLMSYRRKLEQVKFQLSAYKENVKLGVVQATGTFEFESRMYETEAKIIEAELNIKRIQFEKNGGSQIDPRMIPPASTATLRPGEVIEVKSMTDETLNDPRVVVQADRTISLGLVGTINVKGMTPDQVCMELDSRYSAYVKSPEIFVRRLSTFDAQRALER